MDGVFSPPGFDVVLEHLSVGVPSSNWMSLSNWKRRQSGDNVVSVLHRVNARASSGEVMAVLGSSGSGKTTLLHAVVSRLSGLSVLQGKVLIASSTSCHGESTHTASDSCRAVGFVPQHDYLMPNLTVRETLEFAALFHLGATTRPGVRTQIVDQTLQDLRLTDVADNHVGQSGHCGISGGEKRRVSIGCVLVGRPSVLVLDEVTTGLDASSTLHLLDTLRGLAKRGHTIILTIHQPRSDAFHLFDKILLLAQGSVVYCGSPRNCLPYFAALGHLPAEHTNPLDFILDISTVDSRDEGTERDSRERLKRLLHAWKEYELTHDGTNAFGVETKEFYCGVKGRPVETPREHPFSARRFLRQSLALFTRASMNAYRAYPELLGHLVQGLSLGILMGLTFYHLGEQPNDIQSLKTLSFQLVPVYGYVTQVIWTYRWCQSLVIFDREQQDHLYAPLPWVAAEILAWLPINVVAPSIYATLVYSISHLRTDEYATNLAILVADFVLVQLSFVSWSLLAASLMRDFASASALGNSLSLFFILSPGYFLVNVPAWINWFRWLSPHFYSYRIVVISQFRRRSFSCSSISGDALAQCNGSNVLRGLMISANQPIWPYFLGSTAFVIVSLTLAVLFLTFYHPGGVRHVSSVTSRMKGKEAQVAEIDIRQDRVEVTAVNVSLTHTETKSRTFRRTEKTILNGLSASFSSGQLSVVMGPSGSGKSTFLRLCAARPSKAGLFRASRTGGKILFNGAPVSKHTKHLCAFVEQEDDHHLPALTVRETLRFAAMMKLPHTISRKRKLARAEEVLKMLGLQHCADNMVGGELLKGISGGEKRRLSLACQMINDPPVLIADEPTSGLDASTAKNVMEALRNLARSGRTVIVSIHQPRSDIWNMCDSVTMLAKGGRVVYHGQRDGLLSHLAAADYNCPPLYNPADFALDLVAADGHSPPCVDHASRLADIWRSHAMNATTAPCCSHDKPEEGLVVGAQSGRPQQTLIHIALPCLLDRMFRNTWRQGPAFRLRFVQPSLVGLLFFLFFLRLTKGPAGAQDRIGVVAECTSIMSFVGFLNVVALYPAEKAAFFHDYKTAGARYSGGAFLAAFSLFAFIPEVLAALCFTVLVNIGMGMQTSPRIFLEFVAAIWMQLNFGESVGVVFASFVDTVGLAVSLVSLFLTMAAQSSGISSAAIVPFLADVAWIFPVKYLPRILLVNEMTGLNFDCSLETIQSGECIATTGEQILDTFGFHGSTTKLLFISLVITVAYRLLAWGLLEVRLRFVS